MVSIIIKSFNRPYYLDRCIQTIYKHIKGNFTIVVTDDGTPEKYLNKIQEKYPEIKILLSSQADEKRKAIAENLASSKPIDGFKIPTDLWKETVQKSSDYVLVIEDDVWMVDDLQLDVLISEIKKSKIPLVKLGWLGNTKDKAFCKYDSLSTLLLDCSPKKLFTSNKWIMDAFFYNKFKFFTFLYKLGIVNNFTKEKYWSLNSILMGLYEKNYWLCIWEDANGVVDEKQQLRNASAWYHQNRDAIFAKTKTEYLKTTFKSSATGSYHEYGNHFDVNRFNYIMNEAWLKGDFNCMENYPKDFSDSYFTKFLQEANHKDARPEEWLQWAEKFKLQYQNIGADVA